MASRTHFHLAKRYQPSFRFSIFYAPPPYSLFGQEAHHIWEGELGDASRATTWFSCCRRTRSVSDQRFLAGYTTDPHSDLVRMLKSTKHGLCDRPSERIKMFFVPRHPRDPL